MSKKTVCGLLIGGFILFLEVFNIFYLNVSASIPTGIYVRQFGEVHDGDIVVYVPNDMTREIGLERGYFRSKTKFFIKHAYLLGGGDYYIDAATREVYVDNKLIGISQQFDSEGRTLPFSPGLHNVSKDEFLPLGDSERSFDGRYTGAVSKEKIVCKVIPFILWDME